MHKGAIKCMVYESNGKDHGILTFFVEFRNAYNSEEYGLLKGMRKEI